MPAMYMDVDAALSEVPINIAPLIDDTDFKTREESIVFNQAGLDLVWNFTTSAGVFTQTAVTPTDAAGDYDWVNQGNAMYTIEIPASGAASINNDTEGYGWFSGFATGVLPWIGPVIGFRAAGLNNLLTDDAFSATRGLVGTALPDAVADAAGGLPISDTGNLDLDNRMPAAGTVTNLNTLYDGVEGFAGAYAGPRGPGVYLNDTAANTNTVNGVDGTWANPVSTIAAAKTIADSLGVDRIYLVNNSDVLLGAAMPDYEFVGIGEDTVNTIDLGTRDVDNSAFYNVLITGAQGGTGRFKAERCCLSAITGMEITARECIIADGASLVLRNDCAFDACFSAVSGLGTPVLDINSVANVNVYFRHYSGGIQIDNAVATTVMSWEGMGQFIVGATCVSLSIVPRGIVTFTDNGTTTNLLTNDATINLTNINAECDTAISDAALATAVNLADVPTVAEFNARTLVAASYFDPAADTVATVTTVGTTTTNTDMRGTDGANTTTPLTAAEVNAEVVDVIRTDASTEPAQGAPPLSASLQTKVDWLYKVFRNRKTQTATQWSLLADDEATVDAKATVSSDGTTAIKQEVVTGP